MVETSVLNRSSNGGVGERGTPRQGPARLLVLASKPPGRSPSQRFRLEQWAPRLAHDHDILLDFAPFECRRLTEVLYQPGRHLTKAALTSRDLLRRAKTILRARNYDAVVIHREAALIGPAIYERLIAWSGKPIIFDFDDSIWSHAQFTGNGIFSRLHFFGKTKTICRLATAITPGNEFLAEYARQWNDKVFPMPTSIDLNDYPVVPEPETDSPFIVCWTGSTSTLAHFEYAREALETIAQELPLVVKVICNRPPERPIAGAELQFVPWTAETEGRDIGESHVGIMPLPDNEATRGKCGLKALQSMATGRPVVISPVGMNRELVRSGENGFLACTTDDYVNSLRQLADSRELRHRMGREARLTVEREYSAEVISSRFAAVVRQVLS